jgi:hypothetical protein
MIYNSKWWSYRIVKLEGKEIYKIAFVQRVFSWLPFAWDIFHQEYIFKDEAKRRIIEQIEKDNKPSPVYKPCD